MARKTRTPMEPRASMADGEVGTRADYVGGDEYSERRNIRDINRDADALFTERLPQRSADAVRMTPRTIEDAANPLMSRTLADETVARKPMTSRRKKDLAKGKREVLVALPKTQHRALATAVGDHRKMEQLNRVLSATAGNPHAEGVPESMQRVFRQTDLAIQAFERHNAREHIVYAPAFAPHDAGSSREAYIRRLEDTIENDGTLEFDRYIAADHSLSNLESNFGREIVFEIKTRSGAYLGSSDTLPDAVHLLPRGRVLKPTAVLRDVPYTKPDGSTGSWARVVQFEDVTE
jgi:hypothetical protein